MNPREASYFRSGDFECGFLNAYQPIIDTRSKQTFAYEALVRGVKGESAFSVLDSVPTDLKSPFDQLIREAAISRAVALDLDTRLTLNMGTTCLLSEHKYVMQTLRHASDCGFPLENLIIELTEADVIHGIPGLVDILREIHAAGATVALDDFGAGYAGLNSLIDVNPDIIKLDMYLIRDINRSGPRQATVRALVGLADDLGIELIAEGVETEAELKFLNQIGINLIQGYLLARPAICELPTFSVAI